jgi:hypothetical protein
MTKQPDEFDSPWKEILETYFPDFLNFFFPSIYSEIDWQKGYNFLDRELATITKDAEIGKRFADKLVKLWKSTGEEMWVLVHVEIQSQENNDFSERIFIYYYRLRDKYKLPIVSLAILGDENENWRPQAFDSQLWGCRVQFEFPTIKLLDYTARWDELEASLNPFAVVVMAHLKTKETRDDAINRKEWKFRLTRGLYERGYQKQDIMNLFRFIDWLLDLPDDLKRAFRDELTAYERENQMPYVTSIERMGIERGIEQGIERGIEQGIERGKDEQRQAIARKMLAQNISLETIAELTELPLERVRQLQADT